MTRILKRPAEVSSAVRLPQHVVPTTSLPTPSVALAPDPGLPAAELREAVRAAQAAAQAELDALRDRAVREGREQGYAAAQAEIKAALDAELLRARRMLDGIEASVNDKLAALEPMAVRIAFEAVAVLMGEAYASGDGVTQAVRMLLASSATKTRLRVQVPPAHLEQVRAALASSSSDDGPRTVSFEADPSLVQACRVVSEHGQLETGLAVQLQAIQDALLRAADRAMPSSTTEAAT